MMHGTHIYFAYQQFMLKEGFFQLTGMAACMQGDGGMGELGGTCSNV